VGGLSVTVGAVDGAFVWGLVAGVGHFAGTDFRVNTLFTQSLWTQLQMQYETPAQAGVLVVGDPGLEPGTSPLSAGCSNQLS
jgi:hypothetical protein